MMLRPLPRLFLYLLHLLSTLSNSAAITPSPSSKWTRPRCPPPVPPANGRAKLRSWGDSVSYRCQRRFILLGDFASASCYRGRWVPSMSDPGAPICASRGCTWQEDQRNDTTLIGRVGLGGAVVELRCASGFRLEGSRVMFCVDGSNWNGTLPRCIADDHDDMRFDDKTTEKAAEESLLPKFETDGPVTNGTGKEGQSWTASDLLMSFSAPTLIIFVLVIAAAAVIIVTIVCALVPKCKKEKTSQLDNEDGISLDSRRRLSDEESLDFTLSSPTSAMLDQQQLSPPRYDMVAQQYGGIRSRQITSI